jgi:hypothetical protein
MDKGQWIIDNWQLTIDNWELTRNREMGSREIRILNYEFSFCLFFFCRCGYSFVQRQWFCLSGRNGSDAFVRRSHTCGYECFCLSGKSEPVNWKLFGLEKPIFITAEFILRHESSSETCLKGSTFICHEGAKTRSWLRPQNIITPVLPGGSTCPLILRGRLYGKCDPTPLLR